MLQWNALAFSYLFGDSIAASPPCSAPRASCSIRKALELPAGVAAGCHQCLETSTTEARGDHTIHCPLRPGSFISWITRSTTT